MQKSIASYFGGREKPQKRILTTEEKCKKSKEYDKNKRARSVGQTWTTEFPWLIVNDNVNQNEHVVEGHCNVGFAKLTHI